MQQPSPPELDARVLAWAFGGDLPSGSIALGLDGCQSAEIRTVTQTDFDYWNERLGPPIRLDLLAKVRVGCDLYLMVKPETAQEYFKHHDPGPREAYYAIRQWDFTFRADQALDLVKLLASVPVAMAFSEVRIKTSRGHYSQSINSVSMTGFPAGLVGQKWSLAQQEVDALPGLWQNLVAGPNASTLRFALRRWGSALQRKWPEDRLIDLWIGLEGLFKRESESRSNSDRVANRISRLLSLDRQNRRLLISQLADSYRLRNEVAHGKTAYDEEALKTAVADTNRWLRRALRELVIASAQIDTLA